MGHPLPVTRPVTVWLHGGLSRLELPPESGGVWGRLLQGSGGSCNAVWGLKPLPYTPLHVVCGLHFHGVLEAPRKPQWRGRGTRGLCLIKHELLPTSGPLHILFLCLEHRTPVAGECLPRLQSAPEFSALRGSFTPRPGWVSLL